MKRYCFFSIILLSMYSCTYDQMEKTIFIPDENDSNLPAYTEWGYNSFGAKYERLYFFATRDIVPCKIVYQDGILSFSLCGCTATEYSIWYNNDEMTLTFSFPSSTIDNYKNLLTLHEKEFDLTDSSCEVKMIKNYQEENITVLSGHLNFKRVQLLRIDDKDNRAILSGTFDLKFLRGDRPEIISGGRFDLGITEVFCLEE